MVFTRPGRTLSRLVQNALVSIPDIAWIAPFPSPSMARSHGIFQPTLGQLSASDNLAGTLASILSPRTGGTGVTWHVLVVGAPHEAAGIRNLIQVNVGRRCLKFARLHVAALAAGSLHLVGQPTAAPLGLPRGALRRTSVIIAQHAHCGLLRCGLFDKWRVWRRAWSVGAKRR